MSVNASGCGLYSFSHRNPAVQPHAGVSHGATLGCQSRAWAWTEAGVGVSPSSAACSRGMRPPNLPRLGRSLESCQDDDLCVLAGGYGQVKELAGSPHAREGWRLLRARCSPCLPSTRTHTCTHTHVCTQGHAHTAQAFRKAGLRGSSDSAFQRLSELSAPQVGGRGGPGSGSLGWVMEPLCCQTQRAGFLRCQLDLGNGPSMISS